MATLARQTRRIFLPTIQSNLSQSLFASSLIPTILQRLAWPIIPAAQSLLQLFPSFVFAVPKSKISHSRKSMRSANKGLKDKQSSWYHFWVAPFLHWVPRYCELSRMRRTQTCSQSLFQLLYFSQSDMEKQEKAGWWRRYTRLVMILYIRYGTISIL